MHLVWQKDTVIVKKLKNIIATIEAEEAGEQIGKAVSKEIG